MFYRVDFGSLYIYVKIYQPVHVNLCILLNVDYNSILRIRKNIKARSIFNAIFISGFIRTRSKYFLSH